MLYVEGTKKAIRHYVKLMTHRIKWNETVSNEGGEAEQNTPNGCTMLWQVRLCIDCQAGDYQTISI